MARRSTPALPGLSRSPLCRSKACTRLSGHKGDHRTATKSPKSPVTVAMDGGVEVRSADVYTVLPERKPKAGKAPAVVLDQVVLGFRVVVFDDGSVTSTKVVPAKARKVRKVAFVEPKARIGVSGVVGQHRTARRPKAAPAISAER